MKVRDSALPDDDMWNNFFDPTKISTTFGIGAETGAVVEFGSGYGTFTIPAARFAYGTVYVLDTEPELIEFVREICKQDGVESIRLLLRDFLFGSPRHPNYSMDSALLLTILPYEEPVATLKKALEVFKSEGIAVVIEWNDALTPPRAPALAITHDPSSRGGFSLHCLPKR